METTRRQYWKARRFWWFRPAILGPAIGLTLIGIPMAWWISTYGDMVAVGMFVLTYALLLGFVVLMLRRSLLDTVQKVNTSAVRTTRNEVDEERVRRRQEMMAKDLAAIKEGHPTAVLDIWRLDEKLRDRHPFFQLIAASTLDPRGRELHLRIHLTDPAFGELMARRPNELLSELADFLHLVARDVYFRAVRPHADALILEVYRMVDDGSFHGSPAPTFSMHARFAELDRFAASTAPGALPGDVRFSAGASIEPHRSITLRDSSATK